MSEKLLVLIINDMVIFPNNEVRIEYDNNYDKQMVEIVDKIEDNLMLIVNPIEEGNIDVTSFPKYGVLGRLKLKMSVPNGKTRIVIEGIERVELPIEYQQVAYIESTGEQYIDTEVVPNQDTTVIVNYNVRETNANSNRSIFGARVNTDRNHYGITYGSGSSQILYSGYGSSNYITNLRPPTLVDINIIKNKNNVQVSFNN